MFGPRGTGKSFLIRQQFGENAIIFDLLRSELFLRLSSHPEQLEAMIAAHKTKKIPYVIIDEIQRIPFLLNEVHRLIEEKKYIFY